MELGNIPRTPTLVGVLPVVKAEVDHFMFTHRAERVTDFRFLLDLRAHESQQMHNALIPPPRGM